MLFLKVFGIAFFAMLGIEVALGLCIAIGEMSKGASKNDKH